MLTEPVKTHSGMPREMSKSSSLCYLRATPGRILRVLPGRLHLADNIDRRREMHILRRWNVVRSNVRYVIPRIGDRKWLDANSIYVIQILRTIPYIKNTMQ